MSAELMQQELFKKFNAFLRRRINNETLEAAVAEHMQQCPASLADCLQLLDVYADQNSLGGVRYDRIRKRILNAAQNQGEADDVTVPLDAAGIAFTGDVKPGANPFGVGKIIQERYLIEAIIGRGGLSVIYKAQDLRRVDSGDPNPYVAIKMLSPEFRSRPECRAILQQEAVIAQRCRHENVIAIYDLDREGQELFLVTEFIEGKSLAELLKTDGFTGFSPDSIKPLVGSVCSGLEYLHEHGLVHADIKPGNIIVDGESDLRIIDFGNAFLLGSEKQQLNHDKAKALVEEVEPVGFDLAQQTEEQNSAEDPNNDASVSMPSAAGNPLGGVGETNNSETNNIAVSGADDKVAGANARDNTDNDGQTAALTPNYAAIDVLAGETPEQADDVFALGCVISEMISGQHPYGRKNAQLAYQQRLKPQLPKGLRWGQRRALQKALSHDRAERPTVSDFWAQYSGEKPRGNLRRFVGIAAVCLLVAGALWFGVAQPYQQGQDIRGQLASSDVYAQGQAIGRLNQMPSLWRDNIVEDYEQRLGQYYSMRIADLADAARISRGPMRKEIADIRQEVEQLGLSEYTGERLAQMEQLMLETAARGLQERIDNYIAANRLLDGELRSARRLVDELSEIDRAAAQVYDEKMMSAASAELAASVAEGDTQRIRQLFDALQQVYPEAPILIEVAKTLPNVDVAAIEARAEQASASQDAAEQSSSSASASSGESDATQANAAEQSTISNASLSRNNQQNTVASSSSDSASNRASNDQVENQANATSASESPTVEPVNTDGSTENTLAETPSDKDNRQSNSNAANQPASAVNAAVNASAETSTAADTASAVKQISRLAQRGSLTKARALLKQAQQQGNSEVIEQSRRAVVAAHIRYGDSLVANNAFTKAVNELRKLKQYYPRDSRLRQKNNDYESQRGVFMLRNAASGRYDMASAKVLSSARDLRRNQPETYSMLSDALTSEIVVRLESLLASDPARARRFANAAAQVFPEKQDFYRALGDSGTYTIQPGEF